MNDEIPYNPPGLDEYIREGARHNSRLLRKWKRAKVIKSHDLAAKLLALPNLPVYRHRDDEDPDESCALEPIGTAEKITACDAEENPTIDCIILDGVTLTMEDVAEPSNKADMPNQKSV
jgi:hypothetical protein